eukprot:m.81148 g.81148  ORF g.81148 m.81148 type:complete len:1330 (+) comp12793_c0_seq1:169-4158(+)
MAEGATNVKVAVRVRPFNTRERIARMPLIVKMQNGTSTVLSNPKTGADKTFHFDHSFWTFDQEDSHFAGQEQVFQSLGVGVLDNAFKGFNACIFAYGQTGSGKTYSMMGTKTERGIIPRLCTGLYDRMAANDDPNLSFKVEVSYMEIYNEKVKDLLSVGNNTKKNLRVREHKVMGPYVEGLTKLAVAGYESIETLMEEGNKKRHTASHALNAESSRSHAVFTLFFTQARYDSATDSTGEKVSRISLVDLAGSERQSKTQATGDRLKEGSNINKSLTTLGLVISALAKQGDSGGKKKDGKEFVPYRDSVLTWLLKDNLGGNAKTVMIATLSPASDNFEETLSTLRYADRAKSIVNKATINEDPNARLIRELREELERLRTQAGSGGGGGSDAEAKELREKLLETEGMIQEMTKSWEEKLKESENIVAQHRKLLNDHKATFKGDAGGRGLQLQSTLPHFVSLSQGLDFQITIYTLPEGITRLGTEEAEEPPDVILVGDNVQSEHAIVENEFKLNEELGVIEERVWLEPVNETCECHVNGKRISERVELHQADVVEFEDNTFRFNHPTQAKRLQKEKKEGRLKQTGEKPAQESSGNPMLAPRIFEEFTKKSREALEAGQRELEAEKERSAQLLEKLQAEEEKKRLEAEQLKEHAQRMQEEREREKLELEKRAEEMAKAMVEERRLREERELAVNQEREQRERIESERLAKEKEIEQLRTQQEELERRQIDLAKQREQDEKAAEERMQQMIAAEREKVKQEAELEKARIQSELLEKLKEAEAKSSAKEALEEETARKEEELRKEAERRVVETEGRLEGQLKRMHLDSAREKLEWQNRERELRLNMERQQKEMAAQRKLLEDQRVRRELQKKQEEEAKKLREKRLQTEAQKKKMEQALLEEQRKAEALARQKRELEESRKDSSGLDEKAKRAERLRRVQEKEQQALAAIEKKREEARKRKLLEAQNQQAKLERNKLEEKIAKSVADDFDLKKAPKKFDSKSAVWTDAQKAQMERRASQTSFNSPESITPAVTPPLMNIPPTIPALNLPENNPFGPPPSQPLPSDPFGPPPTVANNNPFEDTSTAVPTSANIFGAPPQTSLYSTSSGPTPMMTGSYPQPFASGSPQGSFEAPSENIFGSPPPVVPQQVTMSQAPVPGYTPFAASPPVQAPQRSVPVGQRATQGVITTNLGTHHDRMFANQPQPSRGVSDTPFEVPQNSSGRRFGEERRKKLPQVPPQSKVREEKPYAEDPFSTPPLVTTSTSSKEQDEAARLEALKVQEVEDALQRMQAAQAQYENMKTTPAQQADNKKENKGIFSKMMHKSHSKVQQKFMEGST